MKSNVNDVLCKTLIGAALAVSLVGCGGGGGGGGGGAGSGTTTTSETVTSFPLQSGYRALTANGVSTSFTVSGDCNGTGTRALGAATTAATFEGVAGFAALGSLSMSLTDCTPATTTDNYTSYFDSNYVPLGVLKSDGEYGVFLVAPNLPTSVAVGDTGTVGTETYYTDSSKATLAGTVVESYVVEADSNNTAIINLVSKAYTADGTLKLTEQTRYRITATGTLTPINTDLQYAGQSGIHMVLTYQ